MCMLSYQLQVVEPRCNLCELQVLDPLQEKTDLNQLVGKRNVLSEPVELDILIRSTGRDISWSITMAGVLDHVGLPRWWPW